MYSLIYWHCTCGVTRYNTIHWHKIFIAWLFQMIFIIHSMIIHYKIVWCKWLNNLRHFTIQNTSNHTIIWLKSFCLLKSSVWAALMKSKIIRKISHRLRLHTAWIPLMKSKIIRKIPHGLRLHTVWTSLINLKIIPFVSGANFSPPSSGNHWLLFVKPAERRAQGAGNGAQKGEEPTMKWGWARLLFPQKTRTSVINRCPFTLQIYVLW